ncbi:glycoside hydrolase family 99-like domain-containing protein [Skermania piniformis]|uniref:Glycoside hydrolase family 99-like domain-containing protein n=1 Tax=Skermania pinensis TaxID=39122 RepID=A0ABX8S8U3_9ACTN|nr:glycoside hydrolase family 99-like domain-containing protein [Skermania piniformis]
MARGSGRAAADFPTSWRARPRLSDAETVRLCVLVHLAPADAVQPVLHGIESIPVAFDLIVTNATGLPVEIDRTGIERLCDAVVLDVDCRGHDIWPMLQVINAGLLDRYDTVLKVSPANADSLREVADTYTAARILAAFADDRSVGVIGPRGCIGDDWGTHLETARQLTRRLELEFDERRLTFAVGGTYWIRAFLLQGLRALGMSAHDFASDRDSTAHALDRVIGLLTTESGCRLLTVAELPDSGVADASDYRRGAVPIPAVRVVPFYLPQFHPTEENDRWWGAGFTEWTNVAAAQPVYNGHDQPKLPADLGFYDLRLDAVRDRQATLAEAHGVHAFMYYYYWFAGKRLLNTPIDMLLAGDLHMPFCVMWANENWTRRWDGRAHDILIRQDYDEVPAEEFLDDIAPFLRDERYMRIDGKPLVAVYRIAALPDPQQVIKCWRERSRALGVGELHILGVDVDRTFDGSDRDPASVGLDGTLGFPPHNHKWRWQPRGGLGVDRRFTGNLLSYAAMATAGERKLVRMNATHYPGVMVGFDNTARRQWSSDLWFGSNPYTFRRWLAAAVEAVQDREPDRRVVFVNAWNEWAESAVLEPTLRFGRAYLLAVRDVVNR